tara:strand:+ start:1631 stop:2146 length:516 start_codon:yes stop_codon:yes gene_type:complete
MNTNAYGSLMGNNTPSTTYINQGFMGQNRIGGPSGIMISSPNAASPETLENKYSRLYDQYYDTNQGVFDFSGASGELSSRDFFGGLENDFIKREADRQNKENFLSGFFRAGDSLKPLRDYGGNSPRGQVSGQTLGNMVKEGTYKFPSSTVQKAREASSALPVTQAMSSIFS